MKLKVKLIATSLALTSIISVPVFALTQYGDGSAETTEWDSSLGNHVVGVKKNFGGSNTHGFSWVDPIEDKNCYTQTVIGGISFNKAYGVGYAQSNQEYRPGDVPVSENHGTY